MQSKTCEAVVVVHKILHIKMYIAGISNNLRQLAFLWPTVHAHLQFHYGPGELRTAPLRGQTSFWSTERSRRGLILVYEWCGGQQLYWCRWESHQGGLRALLCWRAQSTVQVVCCQRKLPGCLLDLTALFGAGDGSYTVITAVWSLGRSHGHNSHHRW